MVVKIDCVSSVVKVAVLVEMDTPPAAFVTDMVLVCVEMDIRCDVAVAVVRDAIVEAVARPWTWQVSS